VVGRAWRASSPRVPCSVAVHCRVEQRGDYQIGVGEPRSSDLTLQDENLVAEGEGGGMSHHQNQSPPVDRSAFTGYWFPPEVIMLAVRWYLRYGLSYRDVEEPLVERGIVVDHVTIHRWVQRFTPLLIDVARPWSTLGWWTVVC
jgi:hypothetical protein